MEKITEKINGKDGFSLDVKLTTPELAEIRQLIESHWLETIEKNNSDYVARFRALGLPFYHKADHLLDHANIWCKKARIFPEATINHICNMPFFKRLKSEFDILFLSDDEGMGEEMVWRLVRPNVPDDVGPLHTDAWFWELGHGRPSNSLMERIKIWIPIYSEPGKNGLRIVRGSHFRDWPYTSEVRGGYLKPCFNESVVDLPIELLHTQPGEAIIFHERLLHGGAVNTGEQMRVSLEFDMCVKRL